MEPREDTTRPHACAVDEAAEIDERQVLCSMCYEPFPEEEIHVVPYHNEILSGYVTTYRCLKCWLPSLDDTRDRIAVTDSRDELVSLAEFFERHSVLHREHWEGSRSPVLRQLLMELLSRLRAERLRITIGPAIPIDLERLRRML